MDPLVGTLNVANLSLAMNNTLDTLVGTLNAANFSLAMNDTLDTLVGTLNATNFSSITNDTLGGNSTVPVAPPVLGAIGIIRTVAAFFTNAITLYAFFITPSLHTSFNVYLTCLLCANLFNTLGQGPLDIYIDLNPVWTLGTHACSFYIYNAWAVYGWIVHLHLAITINRFWAIFWPIHYRQRHNKRVAIFICVVTFIYCHLCNLPFVLLDEIYYRLPLEENGCWENTSAQTGYTAFLMIFHFDAVILIDVIACPIILLKKYRSDFKKKAMTVKPISSIATLTTGNSANTCEAKDPTRGSVVPVKKSARKSRGSLIMTLLAISITILWVPSNAYYTFINFYPDYSSDIINDITTNMLLLQSVVDPILFGIALKDIRTAIKNLFACHS